MRHDDALVANIPGIRCRRGAVPQQIESVPRVLPPAPSGGTGRASRCPRDGGDARGLSLRPPCAVAIRLRKRRLVTLCQIQTTPGLTAARAAPRIINPAVEEVAAELDGGAGLCHRLPALGTAAAGGLATVGVATGAVAF
jgi:hypothetical protein